MCRQTQRGAQIEKKNVHLGVQIRPGVRAKPGTSGRFLRGRWFDTPPLVW
jgi:hypothetical protein